MAAGGLVKDEMYKYEKLVPTGTVGEPQTGYPKVYRGMSKKLYNISSKKLIPTRCGGKEK
jgi:hypothetical protein